MLLLALDTSTRQASIALCSENELYGEYSWHVGNNHSVELLESIRRLLAECQVTFQDLDAIAVATGPGSFNGVRVALATAKALAFSLQKSLIGIPTLDVVAVQQQQWPGPVCAVLEAGRSELYAACYLFDEQHTDTGDLTYTMRRVSDYLLLAPQQLATHLQTEGQTEQLLFAGELSVASRQALHAFLQEKSRFVYGMQASRRASLLAMLALQRLREGKEDDPLVIEPLYVRRPSITKSVRKQPLLGGGEQASRDQATTEREEGALRH